uniref:Uncharacterized protein n=1 Tax=Neogobius melanostomus TaxID=47308 RepID=A0A8C6TZC7_9GOBI
PVEQAQAQQVDQEPGGPHPALDRLQDDGEAERREEHGVDQSPHHLGADPAERVLVGGLGLLGEAHRHQSHHQRDHIGQHVEGVRQHRQRGGHAAHHHLHDEEAEKFGKMYCYHGDPPCLWQLY